MVCSAQTRCSRLHYHQDRRLHAAHKCPKNNDSRRRCVSMMCEEKTDVCVVLKDVSKRYQDGSTAKARTHSRWPNGDEGDGRGHRRLVSLSVGVPAQVDEPRPSSLNDFKALKSPMSNWLRCVRSDTGKYICKAFKAVMTGHGISTRQAHHIPHSSAGSPGKRTDRSSRWRYQCCRISAGVDDHPYNSMREL